jgi:hypothetical protein
MDATDPSAAHFRAATIHLDWALPGCVRCPERGFLADRDEGICPFSSATGFPAAFFVAFDLSPVRPADAVAAFALWSDTLTGFATPGLALSRCFALRFPLFSASNRTASSNDKFAGSAFLGNEAKAPLWLT